MYWINTTRTTRCIYRLRQDHDGNKYWGNLGFHFNIYTTELYKTDSPPGLNGDWGFDYSRIDGTLVFRAAGKWYPSNTENLLTHTQATHPLFVRNLAPSSEEADPGDYWFCSNGHIEIRNIYDPEGPPEQLYVGESLNPNSSPFWEDHSELAATGKRPIKVGRGALALLLPLFVQSEPPRIVAK